MIGFDSRTYVPASAYLVHDAYADVRWRIEAAERDRQEAEQLAAQARWERTQQLRGNRSSRSQAAQRAPASCTHACPPRARRPHGQGQARR